MTLNLGLGLTKEEGVDSLSKGLFAGWLMDEGSTTNLAALPGASNPQAVTLEAGVTWVGSGNPSVNYPSADSILFDADTDFGSLGNGLLNSAGIGQTAISMLGWIYPTLADINRDIIQIAGGATTTFQVILTAAAKIAFFARCYTADDGSDELRSVTHSAALALNEWHSFYVCMNATTQQMEIGVDGGTIEKTSTSWTFSSVNGLSEHNVTGVIDTIGDNVGDIFRGRLDHFRLFRQALTQEEFGRWSAT